VHNRGLKRALSDAVTPGADESKVDEAEEQSGQKYMTRVHIDRDWRWLIQPDPSLVAHLCAQELAEAEHMPPYFPELLDQLQLRLEQAKVR
jgi:hypothetical protein